MITDVKDNVYAGKFFKKEKPGFLGECEKMRKEKSRKLFPTVNDINGKMRSKK